MSIGNSVSKPTNLEVSSLVIVIRCLVLIPSLSHEKVLKTEVVKLK